MFYEELFTINKCKLMKEGYFLCAVAIICSNNDQFTVSKFRQRWMILLYLKIAYAALCDEYQGNRSSYKIIKQKQHITFSRLKTCHFLTFCCYSLFQNTFLVENCQKLFLIFKIRLGNNKNDQLCYQHGWLGTYCSPCKYKN